MSRFLSPSYLTSWPYPLIDIESFGTGAGIENQPQYPYLTGTIYSDAMATTANIVSGTLVSSLVTYSNGAAESFDTTANLVSGTMYLGLVTYSNGVSESFDTTANLVSGSMYMGLIVYSYYAPESFATTANLIGGTLT